MPKKPIKRNVGNTTEKKLRYQSRKEFPKFGKTLINALGRGDHLEKQLMGDAVH